MKSSNLFNPLGCARMKQNHTRIALVLLCLMMVQLACIPTGMSGLDVLDQSQFNKDPDGYCERWPDDERCDRRFVDVGLAESDPEAFCKKQPKDEWCQTTVEPDRENGTDTKKYCFMDWQNAGKRIELEEQ
jgi:hypothetical protein